MSFSILLQNPPCAWLQLKESEKKIFNPHSSGVDPRRQFTYDPTGAHPIGRGYPLIIQYIIEWILVSAVIWIIRGNSNIDISMIIL